MKRKYNSTNSVNTTSPAHKIVILSSLWMKTILCEDTPISNMHFLLVAPIKRHTGSTSCVTVQHYLKQSHIISLQTSVTALNNTVVVPLMIELGLANLQQMLYRTWSPWVELNTPNHGVSALTGCCSLAPSTKPLHCFCQVSLLTSTHETERLQYNMQFEPRITDHHFKYSPVLKLISALHCVTTMQ